MSKFKVGDKVVFNRENAKKDIDRLVPGADSWLDDVPKGPLTIKEFLGTYTVHVEECYLLLSTDWLVKADEVKKTDKMEVKFTLGDKIMDVKFSGPATIVFWTDGTKTVVKCRKGDKFDPEKGIAMACAKKLLGNEDGYHKEIAKYADKNAAETLRKEAYKLCGKTKCESCPAKGLSGECPNFLRLGSSELRKLIREMQEDPKYGDS